MRGVVAGRAGQFKQLPRRGQVYVVVVDGLAVLTVTALASRATWSTGSLVGSVSMSAAALVSVEGFRRVGAAHRGANRPFHNLLSVFLLAAAITLPPLYAVAVATVAHLLFQFRALRLPAVKRLFNAAKDVLAVIAAAATRDVLAPGGLSGLNHLTSMTSGAGAVSALAAGAALVAVSEILLVGLLRQVSPTTPWRTQLGDRDSWELTAVDVCAGILAALAWLASPLFFALGLAPMLLLQRGVIYRHLVTTAQTDTKTGLATPGHWRSVAERAVTRSAHVGTPVAVLMVDLDHFKAINDSDGHLAGDEVLTAVADALRLAVRPGDLVGRFGGEEFTVLLPGADVPKATEIAVRIHRRIGIPIGRTGTTGERRHVTASIGVAVFGHHGDDLDELLAAADRALYKAKDTGRDRVVMASVVEDHLNPAATL